MFITSRHERTDHLAQFSMKQFIQIVDRCFLLFLEQSKSEDNIQIIESLKNIIQRKKLSTVIRESLSPEINFEDNEIIPVDKIEERMEIITQFIDGYCDKQDLNMSPYEMSKLGMPLETFAFQKAFENDQFQPQHSPLLYQFFHRFLTQYLFKEKPLTPEEIQAREDMWNAQIQKAQEQNKQNTLKDTILMHIYKCIENKDHSMVPIFNDISKGTYTIEVMEQCVQQLTARKKISPQNIKKIISQYFPDLFHDHTNK